jgi:hypothetical protein
MDKNSKHLFFTLFAVMTIVFYSCKKKKNETSEGIFAGETNSEIMLVTEGVNKTLNPSEGLQSEFVIDINNDSDNDFNFIAKNKYKSGKFIETEVVVNCLNQAQIVKVDSLGDDRIFTAKFKKSALIATFFQFESKTAIFASANTDTTTNTTNIYCDWCNVSENYMAYRVKRKNSNSYQLGWILISVPDSNCNKILIKSWACRK